MEKTTMSYPRAFQDVGSRACLDTIYAKLSLDQYLQASVNRYEACLDALPETCPVGGLRAKARFHHLKLDGNGRPKFKELAQNLTFQILQYCFSTQRRSDALTDADLFELRLEARNFFRDEKRSGEAGEILLWFLLEAVMKAPQLVSKISLKTNPALETFGSDGIHMKWHEDDQILDVYFAEAKLYKDFDKAAKDAVSSIEKFHANDMESFELNMVTRQYKHADDATKAAVLRYVKGTTSAQTIRVNHACLLGYDWDTYSELAQGKLETMVDELRSRYRADLNNLQKTVTSRFDRLKTMRLGFEIFVLPFSSVDKFREAFLEAL